MFRGRNKLQRRDREWGLIFSWRLPPSSGGALCLALALVSGAAFLLGIGVRVRAGAAPGPPGERASLMILSKDGRGDWVERRAIEAGPFPVRWNPAADPEYAARRAEALRAASAPGPPRLPGLTPMEWEGDPDPGEEASAGRAMRLPPLPEIGDPFPETGIDPVVPLVLRLAGRDESLTLIGGEAVLNAETASGEVGVRYLLEYDDRGRIHEIMRLDSEEPRGVIVDWISESRFRGHGGKPGWAVAETFVKP